MSDVLAQLQPILKLNISQKRVLAVALIGGGLVGSSKVKTWVKDAQKEQRELCVILTEEKHGNGKTKRPKVAVDRVFFRRLLKILRICVPSLFSMEMGVIFAQGCLLVSRTFISDAISKIEARAGRYLIAQDFPGFVQGLASFIAVAIPAACVNSGLKFFQKLIQLNFMRNLTHHLHRKYCSNRAYYAASVLRGLNNADQRITEDVEKFSFAISELYSHTLKPLLDVLLFTRSLSQLMGYKNQFLLYGYYLCTAFILRALSPPLALLTAQETGLTGAFRAAHQRLVTNAEEVAFNDPPSGAAEQMILNQHLYRLLRHSRLSAFQRFIQGITDGFFIKYLASVVALLAYGAPMYFSPQKLTKDQNTQNFIRAMRLLGQTSQGVGDLVLVYKRISGLAGHTSRVSELLETVSRLSSGNPAATRRELYMRNISSGNLQEKAVKEDLLPPQRLDGSIIKFDRVALNAPDGTQLVRDLSFELPPGRSVMVMGPNGSGKSSLFRVLAGLWPLLGGEITVPGLGSMFYLSQRPYLVSGTLRDQLLYPQPPRDVISKASEARHADFKHLKGMQLSDEGLDAQLEQALEAVELEYLLARGKGWDQVQNWNDTLSGGERQRLMVARLLFHAPTFAILDEATSAVSADGEQVLYKAVKNAGITMLSIAHRPALRKFHNFIVHFTGNQQGSGWSLEELDQSDSSDAEAKISSSP